MVDRLTSKLSSVKISEKEPRSQGFTFKLAPSQYGMFISLNCKLYLRRSASDHKRYSKITSNATPAGNVSERMQLRGSEWECRICEDLAAVCAVDPTVAYVDCTDLDFNTVFKSLLASSTALTHYLYQATLVIGEEGVPIELQKVDAAISRIIPDLLKLWRESAADPWTLMIIDAKSSLTLKESHQAQVAFYSHFLGLIFAEDIYQGTLRMSEVGGVWLQPAHTHTDITTTPLQISLREFHLKPWLQLLQQHLQHEIPNALSGSIEDVPWHLNAHCGSCPYLEDCRADKRYGPDIRALPHISAADSTLLQKIAKGHAVKSRAPREAAFSVEALRAALSGDVDDPTVTPAVRQRALRAIGDSSKGERNLGAVTSILERRAILKEQLCGTFPVNQDETAVFVALCCDPALGLPFAWAVDSQGCGAFSDCARFSSKPGEVRAEEERVLLSLLTVLCNTVEALAGSADSKRGVTFYVWDSMEKFCLTQLVIKTLCGEFSQLVAAVPGLASRVHYLALMLLDHPEQWHLNVPPSPEYHSANASPRVCELTAQFRKLLHLPIAGFYSSGAVAAWAAGGRRDGVEDISLETIEREWVKGANVSRYLTSRVEELSHSTRYLRETVGESSKRLLFNKSAPLPARGALQVRNFPVGDAIVQRLIFMKHVDVLVRCATAREKRIAGLNNPAQLVRLRCITKDKNLGTFEQLSGPAVFADSAASEFIKKWCLVRDEEEVIVNFADLQYLTEKLYCPDRAVAFVTVKSVAVEAREGASVCILQCTLPSNAQVSVGEDCVLFVREVDLNIAKSIDSLELMGSGALPHTFVRLVSDPNAWSATHSDPLLQGSLAGVPAAALERSRVQVNRIYQSVIDLSGGHESPFAQVGPLAGVQAQAFQRLMHDKLTIVWGPPGTGKTHFAAKSILNLIEMVSRDHSVANLRVLVCATTHAAIDEILGKFLALKTLALSIPDRQDTTAWADCKVFKYKSKPTIASEILEGVQYTEGPTTVTKAKFAVLGATTWSLYKKKKSKAGELGAYESNFKGLFDVVVIDEASQMPVSDALMPLSCLKEGPGGRLLVVGDTLQLPPIFAYKFGPPPPGVPPVQSSVLECLLRTASNHPVDLPGVIEGRVPPPPRMIKLSENFRMNTALSRFTSRLYGADYAPSAVSRNHSGRWAVKVDSSLRALLPGAFVGGRESLPELVSVRLVPHSRKYSTFARSSSKPAVSAPITAEELALTSEHDHLAAEANVVANLIEALAQSQTNTTPDEAAAALFACTPHNNQKASIARELSRRGHPAWGGIADTAERMQGQERDVVVICLGFLSAELVAREIDFLFSKQRLNVAISRAKKSCIVVYTDAMVALNPAVIGNPEANVAYEHLLAFIAASEALGAKCDVSVEF